MAADPAPPAAVTAAGPGAGGGGGDAGPASGAASCPEPPAPPGAATDVLAHRRVPPPATTTTTATAAAPVVGEKVVAGVPWRYGDPAAAFAFGRQVGAGSRSIVRLAVKRGGAATAAAAGAPPLAPLACKRLSKAHPRFSAVDARREVEATAAAVAAADPGAVAALHEVWEDGDAVYLFSDACVGGDLLDALVAGGRDGCGDAAADAAAPPPQAGGPTDAPVSRPHGSKGRAGLPEPAAAAAAAAVLHLLARLHAAGWVHRDVKPENFLYWGDDAARAAAVDAVLAADAAERAGESPPSPPPPAAAAAAAPARFTGRLTAVDFGSAARLPDPPSPQTLPGPPVGSVPYLAPEQLGEAGAASPASDVWAAGCLLHAALTGGLPYGGVDDAATLAAIASGSGGSLAGPAWDGVSAPARHLVATLLAREPGGRPGAAGAAAHPWLVRGGVVEAAPPPPGRRPPRGAARGPSTGGVLGAVTAAAAAGGPQAGAVVAGRLAAAGGRLRAAAAGKVAPALGRVRAALAARADRRRDAAAKAEAAASTAAQLQRAHTAPTRLRRAHSSE